MTTCNGITCNTNDTINKTKEILVKGILTVMKQLKQLERKPRKNYKASMGFKSMTSTIPVHALPTEL